MEIEQAESDEEPGWQDLSDRIGEAGPVPPIDWSLRLPGIGSVFAGLTEQSLEPVWMKRLRTSIPEGVPGTIFNRQVMPEGLLPVVGVAGRITSIIGDAVAGIESPFRKIVEDIGAIAKGLEAYPLEIRAGLLAMSRSGWYLDDQMSARDPIRFKEAVDDNRAADAEGDMTDHFESRTNDIRAELIQDYPHRRKIFDAAFDAHSNGQYVLSIPVLLAQVDGICVDVAKAHFFMAKERLKVVEYVVQLAGSEIARAFLAPFEFEMSVTQSQKSRPEDFSGLNRHTVLHGESVDYGTRENGLRAISLLNYMSQSLKQEAEEADI